MKLWLKQTLITLFVVLLSVSLCLYFFVARETKSLLERACIAGNHETALFAGHLSTLNRESSVSSDSDPVVRQALLQYTFDNHARLLSSGSTAWSLALDGQYLSNASLYHPLSVLPFPEEAESASMILRKSNTPVLISARRLDVLNLTAVIYRSADISDTYAHIDELTRLAQLALLGCLLLCLLLLPAVLRRTLRPLRKLTEITEKIAGGEYDLRSGLQAGDEVGDLSRSFDHMAETVQQKISDLEETSRRRELLLGALTHEMKTPMTAILGFSGSLLSMPLSEKERMEAAYEINEAARRTDRLSRKMMQLISLQENPATLKSTVGAGELLDKVRQTLIPAAEEKKITLKAEAFTDTLTGDPDLLFSLLSNLTDNALKASPESTEITLTARRENSSQILSVADHGSGIPADHLALVTEPFYRVDKARSRKLGGAGLGLSLCQMIARTHDGTLQIESEPDKGTTVSMIWPGEEEAE
ncbi:MAG: HAMP domain-containing histidine kinase [Clostridia bacterium]|nr:HAMP domain-containing histidine kinase [Clostridia bacterium]